MPTVTWTIASIECKIEDQGYQDVVYTIWWRVSAVDGDYSANIPGTQTVTFDPSSPGYQFIPYDQLDEQTVLDWTKSAMGQTAVEEREAMVMQQLNQKMYPSTEIKPLPWALPQ